MDRIESELRIFEAWSNEEWTIEGANVRVSIVCFAAENKDREPIRLNGATVSTIHADLTAGSMNLTTAKRLAENQDVAFIGNQKGGAFDIPGDVARQMLQLPSNPHGEVNAKVIAPWINGLDIVRRPRDFWIIDFTGMVETEAALFEAPFQYAVEHVRPYRTGAAHVSSRATWWLHQRPRHAFRAAMKCRMRYIATARLAKHRVFVWSSNVVVPDSQVVAIAKDDEFTFGVLHSKFHIEWSMRLGTSLEDRPRYTPTTTFETFPFPEGLTPNIPAADYADDPRAIAIAQAAKRLDDLRNNWLNPPDLIDIVPEVVPGYPDRILPKNEKAAAELKKRKLTNLYNARPQWLADAHRDLDAAVAMAYGWPADISEDDALAKLLDLNLARAGAAKTEAADEDGEAEE